MKKWLISTVISTLGLGLSACVHWGPHSATNGGVIIDTRGVDMQGYYQDLHECRNFAAQVRVGTKVAGQAAKGAVVGGAVGAIAGDSDAAARGAGVGAVLGAVRGTEQSYREKQGVVKRCLAGRGYRVLN